VAQQAHLARIDVDPEQHRTMIEKIAPTLLGAWKGALM
jgi:hypothetical protein